MKFKVFYEDNVEFEATGFNQAKQVFKELRPTASATEFDNDRHEYKEVVGTCEVSGLAIFDGDDYTYDEDGICVLKEYDK